MRVAPLWLFGCGIYQYLSCIFVQEQCIETDPVDFECKPALLAVCCCGPHICPPSNCAWRKVDSCWICLLLLWAFLYKQCSCIHDHCGSCFFHVIMLFRPFPQELIKVASRAQVLTKTDSSLEQLMLTQAITDAASAIGNSYKGLTGPPNV